HKQSQEFFIIHAILFAVSPWSAWKHAAWVAVAAPILPGRSTDVRDLTARRGEYLVNIPCSRSLSVLLFGLLLACMSGLSGCDSRPADGTVVQDSRTISEQEKSRVESRYVDRKKNAQKNKQPTLNR